MASRYSVALLCFLVLSPALPAQEKPLTVNLASFMKDADAEAGAVFDAFKTRVEASSRYSVVSGPDGEIRAGVICMKVKTVTDVSAGYACTLFSEFLPPDFAGLSTLLTVGAMAVCPDDNPAACGEGLFEAFVAGTQPDKLQTARTHLAVAATKYALLMDSALHPENAKKK